MRSLFKSYCKEILLILIIFCIIIIPVLLDKIEHSGTYDLTNIDGVVSEVLNKIKSLFKFKN